MLRRLRLVVRAGSALLAGCAGGALGMQDENGQRLYRSGVVAADHTQASAVGAQVLAAGGNAVDAAVATSLALSIVRPASCGVGGGGLMLIHWPASDGRLSREEVVIYRETCPAGVGPDFFASRPRGASRVGGAAVALPGTVAGLLAAHERYGSLELSSVLAPVIRLAEAGFIVDRAYMAAARDVIDEFDRTPQGPDNRRRFPLVWQHYLASGGVAEGDTLRSLGQASLLRLLASRGASGFYEGDVARAIVRAVRDTGGVITLDDLAQPRVEFVRPVIFSAPLQRTIVTVPAPSSGGFVLAQAMTLGVRGIEDERVPAILGRAQGLFPPGPLDGARGIHVLSELMRHGFADRARFLSDMDRDRFELLLCRAIDYAPSWGYWPNRPEPAVFRLDTTIRKPAEDCGSELWRIGEAVMEMDGPAPDDGGTSHFCVVDRWGMAVSCTETINTAFGSLVGVDDFGFVLNNQMDDFTTSPASNAYGLVQSDANAPIPGRRPLSSMTPTFVLDGSGRLEMVVGGSGGPRIISAVTQVILRALMERKGAAEAVSAPRFHHQWSPDVLELEPPLAGGTVARVLQELGYVIRQRGGLTLRGGSASAEGGGIGVVQLLAREGDGWRAACDPRKGGRPAGPADHKSPSGP